MKTILPLCVCLVLFTAPCPGATEPNREAIQSVAAGKSKTARASWWGFDPQESTAALQAAIRSGAEKVVVEKMDSPWIVDRIELVSNQEIVFEPGAIVEAKRGAFHGKRDSLLSAWNASNIRLVGPGATLRMHRADYDGPEYTKAEWRHVLNFHGCTNVTVIGLTLALSGGDGIYLGAGRGGETNKDVVIRDVVCDRNYRQGISVITAENLTIENCVLKDTAGTAPAAGIDFEPNRPSERLVNCLMRNCVMENNRGYGLHIYARPLDGTSLPMSIRVENCVTRGTNARSASLVTSCGPNGAVRGLVELVGCRFEDAGTAGINIGSKPPSGAKLRVVNCVLADSAEEPGNRPPILFSTRAGDLENVGGVEFVDFVLRERCERPLMRFHDMCDLRVVDLSGNLIVHRGGQKTCYKVDQALVDRWMAFDPVTSMLKVPLDGVRLRPATARPSAEALKIPPHRLREESIYLVCAEQGQKVSMRLKYQAVGRRALEPAKVEVRGPAGATVARFTIADSKEQDCAFQADQAGVYTILCHANKHTMRMVSAAQPVALGGPRGRFHFISTAAELYFFVPEGTREFGVRVIGEGEGERVGVALTDPAGKIVWQQADVSASQSYRAVGPDPAPAGVWKIRLSRPASGAFEDHHLELRGVVPVVAFHPDALLVP